MRFFQTLISGAALVAAAAAVITIDTVLSSVVAGQTYTIAFSPKDSNQYTFVLRKGPSNNLATLDTITTTATGGTFSWTVPKTLVDGSDYALQIKQGGQDNYSGLFSLSGGSGVAASSSASAASASASASAASMSSAMSRSASASAASASASAASMSSAMSRSASASAAASASSSKPTGAATTTSSGGPPQNTNAASSLVASPLAAMFGAFAAFAYLA